MKGGIILSISDPNSLNMSGISIDEIFVGKKASVSKTISESDVYTFAGIVADFNPLHVNEEYATQTRFEGRIVHGMLTASFISTVFGMLLPGEGAIYCGQTLKFLAPVHIGETIIAEAEVIKVIPEKRLFISKTIVKLSDGTIVIEGEGTMMATKKIGK